MLYRIVKWEDERRHHQVPVCRAPCDEVVDGRDGRQFLLRAPGMVASPTFMLFGEEGKLTIGVKPGKSSSRIAGWVTLGIGGAFVPLSVALFATGGAGGNDGLQVGGGVTLVTGLVMLASGVVLAFTNTTELSFLKPGKGVVMQF